MIYAIVNYPIPEEILQSGLIAQTNLTARINNSKDKCIVSYSDAYHSIFRGYPTLRQNELLDYIGKYPKEWDNEYIENNEVIVSSMPQQAPFADKHIDNKSLYKRIHGKKESIVIGSNDISFAIPYPACKITGAEFINCEVGDYAEFWILDTASGAITTVPNYPLNQFGFEVQLPSNFYEHKSEYDADLFFGLQIYIRYISISVKDIGINYIINEVK